MNAELAYELSFNISHELMDPWGRWQKQEVARSAKRSGKHLQNTPSVAPLMSICCVSLQVYNGVGGSLVRFHCWHFPFPGGDGSFDIAGEGAGYPSVYPSISLVPLDAFSKQSRHPFIRIWSR